MRPKAILKDDSKLLVMTGQNPERQRAEEGGKPKVVGYDVFCCESGQILIRTKP